MKTLTTSLLTVATLAWAVAPVSAQQTPDFAYINSQRIIEEAPGAQAAQQEFEQDMAAYQTELQELEDSLRTMMDDFEQQQSMLSPEARRQRQETIMQRQQEYQQRAQELQQRAAQRQNELVEPIMQQIQAVIEEIRQERGYTMIFDAASGGLIAADPSLDITNEVLRRLQATASNNP